MKTTLQRAEGTTELEFADAVVHLEGEFGGNIDIVFESAPPLATSDVLRCLWLQVPGESDLLDITGYRSDAGRFGLTYVSDHVRASHRVPREVELFWRSNGDTSLGKIPCAETPSEAYEHYDAIFPEARAAEPGPHPFDDPVIRRQANIRGTLTLIGFFLLLFATIYGLFPEVREWLASLFG